MDKREKTDRQRQEDAALHKALYWMGGAAILVCLLRLAERYRMHLVYGPAHGVLALLPVVVLALAVGTFFWAVRGAQKGAQMVFPWALGAFLSALAVCGGVAIWRGTPGSIELLNYLVIGTAVLAMLYYLYQHDFVAVGLACGMSILGLWLIFREGASTRLYVAIVALVLLLAALAVLARFLQKKDGTLTVKGKSLELLPTGANYALIYVTCALALLVLAAALLFGGAVSTMVWYAVPVAWFLIMAVYYTVKLM